MKKRIISMLLAMAMCFSLVTAALAADFSGVRLTGTHITLTQVRYIEYTYNGKTYRSDQTGGILNYEAWRKMSSREKREVTRWFAGSDSQMEQQFSGAAAMREFANEKSGWKQAGETLRDRLAAADYPALRTFYGGADSGQPRENQLTDGTRAQLTAGELENYDSAANQYNILYETGLEAYRRLMALKQYQINAAVTSISSDLLNIIMKYAMPPQPGTVMDAMKDELKGYIKDCIGIEDAAKDLVGLKKLTGEDKRIESEKAAKAIELYWNLMCIQQKHAEYCMRKCGEQLALVQELQSSCDATAQRRAETKVAEEAQRQEQYENAVNAQAALIEITPDVSGEAPQGPLETTEDYNARLRSAAHAWAMRELDGEEDNLCQLWTGGYDPETFTGVLAADLNYWNSYQSFSAFYTPLFDDYLAITGQEELPGLFSHIPGGLESPEKLFRNGSPGYPGYEDYDKSIQAVYAGFEKAQNKLASIEAEIVACIEARESKAVEFRTAAQPMRNRVYNLTASHCKAASYGNWGIDDALWSSDTLHNGFDDGYRAKCAALGDSIEALYPVLDGVRAQREKVLQYEQDYRRAQADYESGLQERYALYEYTQKDLEYGLDLAMTAIHRLESLQDGYPDWLKNHKYDPIFNELTLSSELQTTFFSGVSAADRASVARERILPDLTYYRQQETLLLEDLERAKGFIRAAAEARMNEDTGLPTDTEAELANMNKRALGDTLIKNQYVLMQEYGYYDYVYGLGDERKELPTKTAVLTPLIEDLMGESKYMYQIRALHSELLEKKGDFLRQAQAGTLRATSAYDDRYYKSGCVASYGSGIYGHAKVHSYLPDNVYNYWYENISPVILELDDVLYRNVPYVGVTALCMPSGLLPNRVPGDPADGPDVTLQVGESVTLGVTVEPENATYPQVLWSSGDDEIAAVDENGVVTGLLPGTVTVTATAVDSPSDQRCTLTYTVQVKAGTCVTVEELGTGYYLLAPRAESTGEGLHITARLGTNGATDPSTGLGQGNQFLDGTAVLAAYDGDRFLGCAMQDCIAYNGELCDLDVTVPLACTPDSAPTVRLYLLERDAYQPASGYLPQTVGGPA